MAILGKRNTLPVIRPAAPGVYLDGGTHGEILLPNRYVPARVAAGDLLEVFVYRDSEDRLVATTEFPRATVGEVATLRVVSVNPRIGAFLDWGLAKDLLLPFREQVGTVKVGQSVVVRIYLDERTERIVASMKRTPSLGQAGYQRVAPLALRIVEALKRNSGRLPFDDATLPETIRQEFGASKKAFKQALGTLYKHRRIQFTKPGIELVDNSDWSPGNEL